MLKLKSIFLIIFCTVLSSCLTPIQYSFYIKPINISVSEVKNNIKFISPKKLSYIGKIMFYDKYILAQENNFGLHVIDNSDPYNPQNIGFIRIPFNQSFDIENNYLYADNLDEIVKIDITDIKNINVVKKVKITNFNSPFSDGLLRIGIQRIRSYTAVPLPPILPFASPAIVPPDEMSFFPQLKGNTSVKLKVNNNKLYLLTSKELYLFDSEGSDIKNSVNITNFDNSENNLDLFFYDNRLIVSATGKISVLDNTRPFEPTLLSSEKTPNCLEAKFQNPYFYFACDSNPTSLGVKYLNNSGNLEYLTKQFLPGIFNWFEIKDNYLFTAYQGSNILVRDIKNPNNKDELTAQVGEINLKEPISMFVSYNKAVILNNQGIYEFDFSKLPGKDALKEVSFIKSEPFYYNVNDYKDRYIKTGDNNYFYKWYKEYLEDK